MYELDIKARPVHLDNSVKYTKKKVQTIIKMFNQGYGFNTVVEKIGKSALGVRGKLERMGYRFREDRFIHEDESQIQ